MIHRLIPVDTSPEKNYGRACNLQCATVPDGSWIALMDYDVLLFPLDLADKLMERYVAKYPDTGIFTCRANRTQNPFQSDYFGAMDAKGDIMESFDKGQKAYLEHAANLTAEPIPTHISGFLMLFSKETWKRFPFNEKPGPLGIDVDFSQRIADAGMPIRSMRAMYAYHFYRLDKDYRDTSHLTPMAN